ncbi:MAG: serine hydrolase [Pseudomonadota bacterium]|jgi:CubicO group peptidase (beta-lactamase class C family)|uniref:serine hydrolase domain-containing protein n=1 Tax=Halopseudomonas TaxID=2901189 RepID=UPI000C939067|nr:serine hydrolase [Pseudomonadales bacterium]MEE2798007.1 serine hydrolase [Pseudomonadota bacterium]|tara:strand:- start:2445 stop:3641 length:1197 start_codon:yes stop_codon:yes gene_type:complete
MKKGILSIIVLLAIACGVFWVTADQDMRRLALNLPTSTNVLFWSDDQRDAGFRALDRLPVLSDSRVIEAGDNVYPLPNGAPLDVGVDVDAYMDAQRAAALIIVHNGKVRLEKYAMDFGPDGRWTSFSVAKSFTSTLVGAAIQDGYIKSIDDMVSDYIPDLKGSAYDNVTIAQLLTMTSGVAWNEDYADPNSDVARFNSHTAEPGMDVTVSYMRQLQAEAEPGTKWVYKTGETNLIGVLASSATNKPLAEYLSEKIWKPFGMQQDATWLLGSTGHEISGCCVQAATRDYARFGLFMLGGGIAGGKQVLPEGWITEATHKQVDIGVPGRGYGYQWWTLDDGAYMAQGIFGQSIFIDPNRQLVIAANGNWPQATDRQGGTQGKDRLAFYRQVQQAIDAEQP